MTPLIRTVRGGLIAGTGGAFVGMLGNLLGAPFSLWDRMVNAENEARVRGSAYTGNARYANLLPGPDAIISAYRRGLLSSDVACLAMTAQGIRPPINALATASDTVRTAIGNQTRQDWRYNDWLSRLWENISYQSMTRPTAEAVTAALVAQWLTEEEYRRMTHGLDANLGWIRKMAESSTLTPGGADIVQLQRLGRIDVPTYTRWMRRAGFVNDEAREMFANLGEIPTLADGLSAFWRGLITPAQLDLYRQGWGYIRDDDWDAVERANLPLPGPAQLLVQAQRDIWNPDTVARWGLDADMPGELTSWLQWHGLNWGAAVTLPDGTVRPELPWPVAQWRSSRTLLTPQEGLLAARLSRSGRFNRLAGLLPGLTEFTSEDLDALLKGYGYPPRMRAWQEALNYAPLDVRTVRMGFLRGVIPQPEARAQLTDRGLTNDDADRQLQVWRAQEDHADAAPLRALEKRVLTRAFAGVEKAYKEGILDAQTAVARLRGLGLSGDAATSYRSLWDADIAAQEVREALTALRRSWLSGALTPLALQQALGQTGLSPEAQARYLRRWSRQRGLNRRLLSTGQVLSAVIGGALSPAVARLNLLNLGWYPGDIDLLLGQAEGKLAQAQVRQSARIAQQARASQREQVQAIRQAQAAQRSLRAELRRTTPLTTLKHWFLSGIRSGQWVRQRLLLLGYDSSLVEAHLSEWTMDGENKAAAQATTEPVPEKLLRRQTGRGTIRSWWQNGVVSDRWARARLAALGYTTDNVNRYLAEWEATLGKKPGPAPDTGPVQPIPAPVPAPGAPAGPGQARQVAQEPRTAGP